MGKRRQKDKREDEDDIDLTGPSCSHIRKGIDRTFIKRTAAESGLTTCQDCTDDGHTTGEEREDGDTPTIWLCLKCGHRGCGRNSDNQHAIKHFEKPRSDPHCLVVSLDNWNVWCYICDDDVQYSRTGHLAQLVTNVKKQVLMEPAKKAPQKSVKVENNPMEEAQEIKTDIVKDKVEEEEDKGSIVNPKKRGKKESAMKEKDVRGSAVKGLSNLGNTCFFNAVVQNLSQTQLLRQILNPLVEEKASLTIMPGNSSHLEPMEVQLEQPGSLTLAMCHLLNEIQETKKGVVDPRGLFNQVCKKASRFKGFAQQDSQELLRYLLDGMRTEEMKRANSGLLEALKKSGEDAERSKTLIKEYEKNGMPRNFVDQVFGGEMTSTVMCQQCKTVSSVTDTFLDLSLPVSDEAYRKKNQKKASPKSDETSQEDGDSLTNGMPSGTGGKYQQKKAKKQAKKQAKTQRRQQKVEGKPTLDDLIGESTHTKAGEEAENGTLTEDQAETDVQGEDPQQAGVDEEEVEVEEDGDASSTSAVSNRFATLSEGQPTEDKLLEDQSPSRVVNVPSTPTEVEDQLASDLENMSLDTAFIGENSDMDVASEHESVEAQEYTVVCQDPELAFRTLATRAAPEKQECSVQSCLFQFTEVEKLTQNNSLLCVTCTKRQPHSKTSEGTKKNVYTDALKQMLISSAPPVLTLHLKRFQQVGHSVCKVNRHVSFPQVLDLAPFCAAHCKEKPSVQSMEAGDSQVLYSLYGIVEHSGTMRSGHYVAYVKTPTHCPSALHNGLSSQGEAETSKGSWFHVSDSSVHPVQEHQVQNSQAYLLFYERIS